MLVLVIVLFLLAAGLLAWRNARRGDAAIRSCCGSAPWPPDDLTAPPSRP